MAGREHGGGTGAMEEGRDGNEAKCQNSEDGGSSNRCHGNDMISVQFMQKILAEILGTYFMIFAGCASVVVNLSTNGTVTFPGICIVWGLVVMVMVYSVGHISGAHFNPAVTIAFATCRRFPWKQVPSYVLAQVLGSTLASLTLRLMFGAAHEHFFGTTPSGSNAQAVALEFIISFYLMFIVSGVATDNRAIGELAGLAVGATVLLNVLFAGYKPISDHLKSHGYKTEIAVVFTPLDVGFFLVFVCMDRLDAQTDNGGVDEPGEKPRAGDRRRPVWRRVGVRRRAGVRDGGGRVGVQPHQVHGQAVAGDHQERVLPQERAKELVGEKPY